MKTQPLHPSSDPRIFETCGPDQTFAFGEVLGRLLKPGLVLFLHGDLGSGKTVFAKGLASGLEVPPACVVTSPTYTLVNLYPGRIAFCHADLYRLSAPVEMEDIGLGEIFDGDGVVAVEWPDRLHPSDCPPVRLDLNFTVTSEKGRRIEVIPYGLAAADLLSIMPVLFSHDPDSGSPFVKH
ncbi:tRNA (adenosine(37)-N6)-threonylcarbamoyltransferase complex ATPase subunit type 1 TsaE [Desulfosarcina sp. OttesenSCG-928-A07]|nr:tRNA (adenosine(37)-N6)-threonylcarbamoyltransferase complex ATPase subunit type 1 TsaE [Desulfosarcina sp. OttesenSCG-928-A07]